MSTDQKTSCDTIEATPRPTSDDLPLFRFRLRQLFVLVSLISLLMAAMTTWHGLTALVLLLATLVVTFHVFSTALGTQLRSHANRMQSRQTSVRALSTPPPYPRTASMQQRSPWHQRRSTPLPWLPRLIVVASVSGGIVGALLLSGIVGDRSSVAGIVVGSLSLAVVAGWFAFVGYSFVGVFRHGLRDAMTEESRDQPR